MAYHDAAPPPLSLSDTATTRRKRTNLCRKIRMVRLLALMLLLTNAPWVESIKRSHTIASLNAATKSHNDAGTIQRPLNSKLILIRGGSSFASEDESISVEDNGENTKASADDETKLETFLHNNNSNNDSEVKSGLSTSVSPEDPAAVIVEEEIASFSEYSPAEEEESAADTDVIVDESGEDEATIEAMEKATNLRLEGKEYHDQGDFAKAAELFDEAANTLLETEAVSARLSEEYATCRLHQALCQLKSEKYDLCIETCNDVLQDGPQEGTLSPLVTSASQSTAVKSRAYHRRAKAKMGLGDTAGALQDARTAAFLGDAKAVALYGKLMRESSSSEISSALNTLLGSQSASPTSSLLGSLMQKSGPSDGGSLGGFPDLSPLSMLMGSGSGGGGNMLDALGGGAGGGLAKSVLKNISKRLDDKATHEQISNFLQNANKNQLRSFASMAGMGDALQDNHLDVVVGFCHRVKPKHIRRTVRTTKVMVYMVKLIRRCFKVINKYKTLLAALLILQWTKSSVFRPIPINKKAARIVAKRALKEGMKATRGIF